MVRKKIVLGKKQIYARMVTAFETAVTEQILFSSNYVLASLLFKINGLPLV